MLPSGPPSVVSIAAKAGGFLDIFIIVVCFPEHSTTGSMHPLTFLDALIFEAQWLQCFPLLQFLLQDLARKTNPSRGLLILSSISP
jgi:hypothetical protein